MCEKFLNCIYKSQVRIIFYFVLKNSTQIKSIDTQRIHVIRSILPCTSLNIYLLFLFFFIALPFFVDAAGLFLAALLPPAACFARVNTRLLSSLCLLSYLYPSRLNCFTPSILSTLFTTAYLTIKPRARFAKTLIIRPPSLNSQLITRDCSVFETPLKYSLEQQLITIPSAPTASSTNLLHRSPQ